MGRSGRPMLLGGMVVALVVAVVLLALGAASLWGLSRLVGDESPVGTVGRVPLAIRVEGNRLVDGSGRVIQLRGVNWSRSQYFCVQGKGIMGGPDDDASIAAMKAWNINAVRIPLNEDCWLGINGVAATMGGAAYRAEIEGYVQRLHAQGLYAILDLHWSAPGSNLAVQRQPLPDADHGVDFWSSVAAAFTSDPAVLFDLYNEPYGVSWACWRDGCTVTDPQYGAYRVAGMQQLIASVRHAGASQPVMVGGLNSANDLSEWIAYAPADPLHQVVASFHMYDTNDCHDPACWKQMIAPVGVRVPVVTGEIGEHDCGAGLIDRYMTWADARGISYLAWAWVPSDCQGYPALIADWTGTPTGFGAGYRAHLAGLVSQTARNHYTRPDD